MQLTRVSINITSNFACSCLKGKLTFIRTHRQEFFMRFILIAFVFLLSTTLGFAGTTKRTVPANKTSAVGAHATYAPNCYGGAIPQMKISKEPKHGAVTFRRTTFKLSKDAGKCAGTPVKGTAIYYKPKRGYRGSDSFTMKFRMDHYVAGPGKFYNVVEKFKIEVK